MLGNGARPPGPRAHADADARACARARDERRAALSRVECARCGAAVLAAKFSPEHTSVQWTAAAVRACWEFSAAGRPSALVEGCGSLRDSIDVAVASGRLEVAPP